MPEKYVEISRAQYLVRLKVEKLLPEATVDYVGTSHLRFVTRNPTFFCHSLWFGQVPHIPARVLLLNDLIEHLGNDRLRFPHCWRLVVKLLSY